MPNLADECKAYHAKIEQSLDNLLKINAELEHEKRLLQEEIDQLKVEEKPSTPDERDQLIDMVAPAIEWKEKYSPNGEFKATIELYRKLRPKKKG